MVYQPEAVHPSTYEDPTPKASPQGTGDRITSDSQPRSITPTQEMFRTEEQANGAGHCTKSNGLRHSMRTAWIWDKPTVATRNLSWHDGSCSSWPRESCRSARSVPMMRRATIDGVRLYGRPAPPSVASVNAHGSHSMQPSALVDSPLLRNLGSPSRASTSSLYSLRSLRSPGQAESESAGGSDATEPSTSASASVSSEDGGASPAYSLLSRLASLGSNTLKSSGAKSDPEAVDHHRLDALADSMVDRPSIVPLQSDGRTMARSAPSSVHRIPLTTARHSDWRDCGKQAMGTTTSKRTTSLRTPFCGRPDSWQLLLS